MINKDGTERRTPTDNKVIKAGNPFRCEGEEIKYNEIEGSWYIGGVCVGSISNASKGVKLNVTTYPFGELAESNGFVFAKKFK